MSLRYIGIYSPLLILLYAVAIRYGRVRFPYGRELDENRPPL